MRWGSRNRDEVDAVLWDPMPGGSGLLDQLLANFGSVRAWAIELVADCPSACNHSCPDCLQTFRNGFYHKYLDRHVAAEMLGGWEGGLRFAHDIPATHPATEHQTRDESPVNDAETKLKRLLEAAGFMAGQFQQQIRFREAIRVNNAIGSTTPDVYFSGDEDDPDDLGVCIYLDGMSQHLHGDPMHAARDREIREWLRNAGYQVLEITRLDLDDRNAMVSHFKKLARFLEGKDFARRVAEDTSWFA